MNNLIVGLDNKKPVAMSWLHNNPFIFWMRFMLFLMLKVKLIFRGVALISAPGLNVMYGDAKKKCSLVGNR
jgi:penicillin amidase